MRVVRAPLRVSLLGGGTDLPSYYEEYGSTIISFAINRCMYLVWNSRPTGGCRLSYSEVEEVCSLTTANHTLVRAAAEQYGIEEPCTLTIVSDVPKGTGLGSSSALAVCLCRLVGATRVSGLDLALTAYQLERGVAPVGWQDHLPAAFGGFNVFDVWPSHGYSDIAGWMKQSTLPCKSWQIINDYGLLLYTGRSRPASEILKNWDKAPMLREIHALADAQAACVANWTPESLGDALEETWQIKQCIPGVCTAVMCEQYEAAKDAGALGGKILGAGGGGCWFFLVPPSKREAVKEVLGLREIPFQVTEKGVEEWVL
jgi:D-glycero-alpha-D-manno-heptose-7-phosphate kinase